MVATIPGGGMRNAWDGPTILQVSVKGARAQAGRRDRHRERVRFGHCPLRLRAADGRRSRATSVPVAFYFRPAREWVPRAAGARAAKRKGESARTACATTLAALFSFSLSRPLFCLSSQAFLTIVEVIMVCAFGAVLAHVVS